MSLFPLGLISQGGGASGGNALTLISTTTLSGNSTAVTFSGISGSYKHLQLRYTVRNNSADTTANMLLVQFNSDTTNTNYKSHRLFGSGSSVSSDESSSAWQGIGFSYATAGSSTASAFTANIMDILDYSQTTKNKTTRLFAGFHVTDYKQLSLDSGLWMNTAAITSITIKPYGAESMVSGSRFSLYGVS